MPATSSKDSKRPAEEPQPKHVGGNENDDEEEKEDEDEGEGEVGFTVSFGANDEQEEDDDDDESVASDDGEEPEEASTGGEKKTSKLSVTASEFKPPFNGVPSHPPSLAHRFAIKS